MGNKNKEKSTRKSIALLAIISLSFVGLIFVSILMISRLIGVEPVNNQVIVIEHKKNPEKNKSQLHKKVKIPVARRGSRFKTNDDIRQEYGMIETVYLYNGKTYTGAVMIHNEDHYKIVTVDGEKNIQMKDVKMRIIIH